MKFIATTSDKINDINVVSGQMIFSRDNRVIYLDTDVRTSFEQIITLLNENVRQSLVTPLKGFYFVKDTSMLWHYENSTWTKVSNEPDERLIFDNKENFPAIGKEKTLYIDKTEMYQWDTESSSYIEMSAPKWSSIS